VHISDVIPPRHPTSGCPWHLHADPSMCMIIVQQASRLTTMRQPNRELGGLLLKLESHFLLSLWCFNFYSSFANLVTVTKVLYSYSCIVYKKHVFGIQNVFYLRNFLVTVTKTIPVAKELIIKFDLSLLSTFS
jgi:hypothetical protein